MAPEPAEDRCGNQLRVIRLGMAEDDLHTDQRAGSEAEPHQDFLAAENVSLRLLLAQAEINTRSLLANTGIEAREREASDKLQKLILEELHHRIKNTLATVGAIVSQSLRSAWTEKNRPAVHPPEKRSYGTRLIETLGKQLKGDVRLTYDSTGFVYAFDVPIASLTSPAA